MTIKTKTAGRGVDRFAVRPLDRAGEKGGCGEIITPPPYPITLTTRTPARSAAAPLAGAEGATGGAKGEDEEGQDARDH